MASDGISCDEDAATPNADAGADSAWASKSRPDLVDPRGHMYMTGQRHHNILDFCGRVGKTSEHDIPPSTSAEHSMALLVNLSFMKRSEVGGLDPVLLLQKTTAHYGRPRGRLCIAFNLGAV